MIVYGITPEMYYPWIIINRHYGEDILKKFNIVIHNTKLEMLRYLK